MKIVILLFTFMVLINFTSAALGNAGRYRTNFGEYSDFDIPLNSQVYVQTPGDHVFINTFPITNENQYPTWVRLPHGADNDEGHVYIRMYGGNGLNTNLMPLHNYARNHHVNGYHCYILLPNDIVVHAFLEPGIQAQNFQRSTSVFIRIPGEHFITYSGVLKPLHGYRPLWLPHASSMPRSRN